MVRIEKPLPGEFEGTLNPEDYGFTVIREEPGSEDEQTRRLAELYASAKARTGIVIPALEDYLEARKTKKRPRHFGAAVARQVRNIRERRGWRD